MPLKKEESPPKNQSSIGSADHTADFEIKQENGQRKYGGPPPNWIGPPPFRGSEVFVGKLPRDLCEEELLSVFSRVGTIYELRLMVDFSGANRGYCFVCFTNRDQAKAACREFNNWEIRPGKHIGVVMSVDNCRLFVGGIPRDRTRDDILVEMQKLTEGVSDVILYPSANDKAKNRGFAFVEFQSHRQAAMARRKLMPGNRVQLWGQPICVDWAEPEQDVDEDTMAQVKKLYVRNLMLHTTEEKIKSEFDQFHPGTVERVKKLKDYAFVHFRERAHALYAMQQLNGMELDGAVIEVVLAKPPDRSIMRYVKNVQKQGGALASDGNVHQNIVAAAAHMYTAAMSPQGTDSGDIANAFTGVPCFASNFPLQPVHQATDISGIRGNRGAAGMRGAGFQAFVNNQVRKNRRRNSENALMCELWPFPGLGAGGGGGVFLIPAPLQLIPAPFSPVPLRRRSSEELEEHCRKQSWGVPQYETSRVVTKDGFGRDLALFACKVTIPTLVSSFGSFQLQRLFAEEEEAKDQAAMFTMLSLGVPLPPAPVTTASGPSSHCFMQKSMLIPGDGRSGADSGFGSEGTPSPETSFWTSEMSAQFPGLLCPAPPPIYPFCQPPVDGSVYPDLLSSVLPTPADPVPLSTLRPPPLATNI